MYSSGGLDYQEVLNFDRLDGNLEAKRYVQTSTRVMFTEFMDLEIGVAVRTSESNCGSSGRGEVRAGSELRLLRGLVSDLARWT